MTKAGTFRYRFKRWVVAAAAATVGLIPSAGNAAGILSGHFAGTAINSEFYIPAFGAFDGSPVTGTFVIDLTGCAASPVPVPYPGSCLASVASFLAAAVPGQSNSYGQPETLVRVFNTPSTQRLSITFGYANPYSVARLELLGGVDAFIIGTDYSSLRAGTIDLAGSTLTLMGGRTYRAGVALSSFTVDQGGASVPDAPTWALMLVGFAMTGIATRTR